MREKVFYECKNVINLPLFNYDCVLMNEFHSLLYITGFLCDYVISHNFPHNFYVLLSHDLSHNKPEYSGSYSLVIENFHVTATYWEILLITDNSYLLWFRQGNNFTYCLVTATHWEYRDIYWFLALWSLLTDLAIHLLSA